MPHLLPGQEVEDAEWEDLPRHHRLPRTPQHAPRLSLRRHRIREKCEKSDDEGGAHVFRRSERAAASHPQAGVQNDARLYPKAWGRQIERSRGLEESHFLASTEHLDSLSRQTVQAWLPTTCAQCNRERTSGTRRASSRPATFCTGCGARLCVKCFFPWHMDRNLSSGEVLSLARRRSQSTDIRRPERRRIMRTRGMQQDEGSSSQSSEGTVSEGAL